MIIRISPLDTFFFRDGKPFSMGEETWADGIFPPAPSVIYGALRSIFLANKKALHLEKAQLDKLTDDLRIKSIHLEFRIDGGRWRTYFPVPNDFVKIKQDTSGDSNETCILELFPNDLISNFNFDFFPSKIFYDKNGNVKNRKVEAVAENSLFRSSTYESYLEGEGETLGYIKDYLLSEPKVGIGRNKITRTSEEGNLYRVDMKRLGDFQFGEDHKYKPENIRFAIDFDFEDWQLMGKQLFKMGGEGKIFGGEVEDSSLEELEFPELLTKNGKTYFKVCLLTPCFFEQGLLPSWIDKNDYTGSYQNLKLKLLSVVSKRPISIGGFDMKAKGPKYMRKAMPSGSVYYFECEGNESAINEKIKRVFHHQSISEWGKKQGFGIAVVGRPQINF
ncbi:MAG: type III-B CRISPR module-associated protein Cmr3 [Chitinophagales bacterium]